MIVSFGEILVDTFHFKSRTEAYVGGAPFNLAYAAHKMGDKVLFVGNIGNDDYGHMIENFFEKNKLEDKGLRVDAERPTTVAEVTLANGDRSFTFKRNDSADDVFSEDSLDFIVEADIVHLGSLMLSSERGRDFFKKVIQFAHAQHKPVSFDINFRSDIFKNKGEAMAIYREVIPMVDILKFSKDEIERFYDTKNIQTVSESFKGQNKLVLITDSKNGSYALANDKIYHADAIKVNAIDPTGAGDAFYGTFLSQVDSLGLSTVTHIPSLMNSTLRFANIAGALATTKKGALSAIPSYKEVSNKLEDVSFGK